MNNVTLPHNHSINALLTPLISLKEETKLQDGRPEHSLILDIIIFVKIKFVPALGINTCGTVDL